MSKFPTAKENLAVSLAFASIGESRYNRTYEEYMDIASRMPPLKALHADVNTLLGEINQAGALYQICHFKAGDGYIRYEDFPKSISIETLRSGLSKVGMRIPNRRRHVSR